MVISLYAIKQDENEEWRILERQPNGRWRRVSGELDEEELAEEIFALIESGDLDAGTILAVITPEGRADRRAVHFCGPEQKRALGYVLDDAPARGRQPDQYDR
jgi:hypothetical protein